MIIYGKKTNPVINLCCKKQGRRIILWTKRRQKPGDYNLFLRKKIFIPISGKQNVRKRIKNGWRILSGTDIMPCTKWDLRRGKRI